MNGMQLLQKPLKKQGILKFKWVVKIESKYVFLSLF